MINKFYLCELANELINIIKERKNVFKTINIIVPSTEIEQWFKTYWLKTENSILMNVKFQNIEEGLLNLFNTNKEYKLLKRSSLKVFIIKHLTSNNDLNLPKDIYDYLHNENKTFDSVKLYDFSNKLAKLFLEYEKDNIIITDWEKDLYDIVLNDALNYNLTTPSHLFNNNKNLKCINQDLYFFGFCNFNQLEKTIIDYISKYNNVLVYQLIQDQSYNKNYEIFTAPSKLREMEAVHTKICTLIQSEDINYSDILVIAPDISQYERIIPRVFNQDNINFPNIPYKINSKNTIDTNVSIGLKKLFDIYNKNYFTRLDLFELINNLDIQLSRNIEENDVINFSESIVIMNAFRNSENIDDWDYVKKRVLLSKVANVNDVNENIVELSDDDYLPYSNIDFNDQAIVKFVSIIDDLKTWCSLLQDIKYINNDNILLIKQQLDKWFSILDNNGFETNQYYKNVISMIYSWIHTSVFNNNVPLNTLFYMLLDASVVMDYNIQSYFTKGITFSNFDINSVLSSKYVFFLNASSHEFPVQVVKSELDIRDYDISNNINIENAFFIQYQNAINKFYISYVNKNLKTDEDYYPSTFILKLKQRNNIKEETIDLDETRSWNQLYTKKEYKNKDYYLSLLNTKIDEIIKEEKIEEKENIKKVKLTDMSSFLKEPLAKKTNIVFGSEDTLEEDIKQEYEPFDLSNLDNSMLVSKIALTLLEEKIDELSTIEIYNLKKRFDLERKIPVINSLINETVFQDIKQKAEEIRSYIKSKTKDNYQVIKLNDLLLNENNNQVVLICNKEMCIMSEGFKRTYFEIKKTKSNVKNSSFLNMYIFSLIDIASINDNNLYEIILDGKKSQTYHVYPSEAKEILTKIYNLMNDYKNNYCIPIDLYKIKDGMMEEVSFNDLIDELRDEYGPWSYFSYKKLFDYEKDLGYTEDQFFEVFKQNLLLIVDMVKYLNIESDGE